MANFRNIGTNFDEGIRTPHYTNGRLLTAEDLQQEQQTQLEKQTQLGKAAGYGIVEGYRVSAVSGNSTLNITAGLGINRKGHVVQLTAGSVALPIQPISDDAPIRRAARFEACNDGENGTAAPVASGAYLLTVSPLAQLEGFVPRKACDGTGTSDCANQWQVEGVEFKIIRLTKYKAPAGNQINRNRNLLAHYFYGSDEISTLMRDPMKFPANYTGFSEISAEDFTECDLPLAVFYWSNNKIAFLDEWAVRRRLIHPYPANNWTANLSDQRQAEGQARFLQFQDQIADLQAQFGSKTATLRAVDRFAFLPPVGILPVNPFELIVADVFDETMTDERRVELKRLKLKEADVLEQVRKGVLASFGSDDVFNLERFFGDLLSSHYLILHEDYVHDRLHQSWVQPPILLPPPPSDSGKYFDFVQVDGTLVQVNENNFNLVMANINKKFTNAVYTPKTILPVTLVENVLEERMVEPGEETAVGRINRALRGAVETRPGVTAELEAPNDNLNLLTTIGLIKTHHVLRPGIEIFNPPRGGDDDEIDPLIDIFVIDELLVPYRDQLGEEMNSRIDDAVTTLSGNGGGFIDTNRYKLFNKSVSNAYLINKYLWKAANFGQFELGNFVKYIQQVKPPTFYVVFVRHRPNIVRRPLRL